MVKTCIKCLAVLPITEFYSNRGMADGRLNKCIGCVKQYEKERRERNIDVFKAYDRARANLPHRIKNRKEYLRTENGKAAKARAISNYNKKNPSKRAAHIIVNNALRDGKLQREFCLLCDNPKVHAHHRDYSKPLEVDWLCTRHHREVHQMPEILG